MDISTTKTQCIIRVSAGAIRELTSYLGKPNLKNAFQEGLADNDTLILAGMLAKLTNLKTEEKALYFIDEYLIENKDKTIQDLYMSIAEAINEAGFFKKRLKPEELKPYLEEIEINQQILIKEMLNRMSMQTANQAVSLVMKDNNVQQTLKDKLTSK